MKTIHKIYFVVLVLCISNTKTVAAVKHYCDTCFISYSTFKKMTKEEIMSKYGTNDTSKAIVNYFHQKQKRIRKKIKFGSSILFGASTILSGLFINANRNPSYTNYFFPDLDKGSGYLYSAIVILFLGLPYLAIHLVGLIVNRKKVLYNELKTYYTTGNISTYMSWQKPFKK